MQYQVLQVLKIGCLVFVLNSYNTRFTLCLNIKSVLHGLLDPVSTFPLNTTRQLPEIFGKKVERHL